jgi:hypothetical protein
MKLPALSRFLSPPTPSSPPAAWRLDGFEAVPKLSPWSRGQILLPRSRCRLRWFRLHGIPAPERMAALRLQVEAWRPFDRTDARLALNGEQGLAVAWDAAALQQAALAAELPLDRYQLLPETFARAAAADGLHLVRAAEGFEAQQWQEGQLVASRWWPQDLTESDWQEFVRACGASRDAGPARMPDPEIVAFSTTSWTRHHPLHASAATERSAERRLVFLGGMGLLLGVGIMAHQLWDAHSRERGLALQVAELKAAAGPVVAARDATLAQLAEVEKLSNWFAVPQPIDVIGHLNDTLAASGAQVKELELEGDKLKIALQLGPNTARANVVRDLQAGGWLADATEVRADNARNLLTMEMRIRGPLPPVVAAPAPVAVAAPPVMTSAAPAVAAPAPAPSPAVQAPAPAAAPKGPPQPGKPIVAKPDANGMPPASVFDAIPGR